MASCQGAGARAACSGDVVAASSSMASEAGGRRPRAVAGESTGTAPATSRTTQGSPICMEDRVCEHI
uniref:Uncharacterized protein n=1 Tax=Leersia perrieri TaxID=77586 RepID=A0A0D9W3G1_9ORYZ